MTECLHTSRMWTDNSNQTAILLLRLSWRISLSRVSFLLQIFSATSHFGSFRRTGNGLRQSLRHGENSLHALLYRKLLYRKREYVHFGFSHLVCSFATGSSVRNTLRNVRTILRVCTRGKQSESRSKHVVGHDR